MLAPSLARVRAHFLSSRSYFCWVSSALLYFLLRSGYTAGTLPVIFCLAAVGPAGERASVRSILLCSICVRRGVRSVMGDKRFTVLG